MEEEFLSTASRWLHRLVWLRASAISIVIRERGKLDNTSADLVVWHPLGVVYPQHHRVSEHSEPLSHV